MAEPKGRRILFLDVDGVLNNGRIFERSECPDRVWFDSQPFSRASLCLIARAVQAFGLEIVLSSSWRCDWAEQLPHHVALQAALASVGLTISGFTPEYALYGSGVRGREIRAWLEQNPDAAAFVIVDDINDMPGLERHLVLTDFENGFTGRDLRRLRHMLRQSGAAPLHSAAWPGNIRDGRWRRRGGRC